MSRKRKSRSPCPTVCGHDRAQGRVYMGDAGPFCYRCAEKEGQALWAMFEEFYSQNGNSFLLPKEQ